MTMTRILNRQRQLAEAGRLRLGLTVQSSNGKTRPTRSDTWIFTSPDRTKAEAAAQLWGGEVEHWQPMGNGGKQWRVITKATSIDAILPSGDPLSQAYEQWNKGGCVRRCNGETESFSGSPCLCLAEFGEQWHEQPKGRVCDTKSRLKVLLPELPGLGSYRIETGSYYAADEIAGVVDFIRGAVGDSALVPIRVRIEQRTRVAGGETKHFPVPVVELRGVTTGALLGPQAERTFQIGSAATESRQIGSAPAVDYLAGIADAGSTEELNVIWRKAGEAGDLTDDLKAAMKDRAAQLAPLDQPVDAQEIPDETPVADVNAAWMNVVTVAGQNGWTQTQLERAFEQFAAVPVADADTVQITEFLAALRRGDVDAPAVA
jgi:hypothetical protein